MHKHFKIFIIILMSLTLSGCWDKVEINDRAFITAIGMDINEQAESEREKSRIQQRYLITYVFPNFQSIGKNSGDEEEFKISEVGRNLAETSQEITTRTNLSIFLGHLKIIVLGEDVVKNGGTFEEILDGFERDQNVGRKVVILIAEGKAKDVLEIEPIVESATGRYITRFIEAKSRSARYNPETLGDILYNIHYNGNALIAKVTAGKDEIKIAGAAVIKNNELVGWLDEIENRSILFTKQNIELEVITVVHDDLSVPYAVTGSKPTMSVIKDEGNLKVNFDIEVEGYIKEYKLETGNDLMDNEILVSIEEEVKKEIEKEISMAIEKVQKDFKVDVLGVGRHLERYEPDLWEDIKGEWEELFPNIDIQVTVEAKIRRIGMIK